MRLMVTGGRYFGMHRPGKADGWAWSERSREIRELNEIHAATPITLLIHGDCPYGGADLIADIWARSNGVPACPVPVDHRLDGPWPGAGPRRNGRQISLEPEKVLAMPGDKGTADAVHRAQAAKIEVLDLRGIYL